MLGWWAAEIVDQRFNLNLIAVQVVPFCRSYDLLTPVRKHSMSVCVRLCFIFKDLAFFPELFHDACFPPTSSNDSQCRRCHQLQEHRHCLSPSPASAAATAVSVSLNIVLANAASVAIPIPHPCVPKAVSFVGAVIVAGLKFSQSRGAREMTPESTRHL